MKKRFEVNPNYCVSYIPFDYLIWDHERKDYIKGFNNAGFAEKYCKIANILNKWCGK